MSLRYYPLKAMSLCAIVLQSCLPGWAQSQVQPQSGDDASFSLPARAKRELSPLDREIYNLLQADKIEEADKKIDEEIALARQHKTIDASMLYLSAFAQFKDEHYGKAAAILKEIQELPERRGLPNLQSQVVLQRLIAECYYRDRNCSEALKHFNLALICAGRSDIGNALRAEIEEGLVGCYLLEKRYHEAEAPALRLCELTKPQSSSLMGICPYFWSNVYLAEIYKNLHNKPKFDLHSQSLKQLLGQMMGFFNDVDNTAGTIPLHVIRNQFLKAYMDETQPQSLAEYLWLATTYKLKTLPVIVWRDRNPGATIKANIIAVHGMGLDNRAFANFAHEMKRRGYAIYALDVRGFGSWMNASGNENIDYKDSFGDINNLVEMIKSHDPQTPAFLLGESMGGAIALNTTSQYEKDFRGVIASVPSAEVMQARKMSLTVAMHFLRGPDKPFNVGTQIASQATARPELRQLWHESLKAKNELSPKEMIHFAAFMRHTERHCRNIKTTPVFMVQGLKDKLVKPQGTYDLFGAVKSDDKTMLIVGDAEHLIFETDKQNMLVLDSICAWMDKHSANRPAESGAVAVTPEGITSAQNQSSPTGSKHEKAKRAGRERKSKLSSGASD
jgi:acylglycerol lipase